MSVKLRDVLIGIAVTYGIASIACGSGPDEEPAPEPTLEERCERRCAEVPEPPEDADEEDRNPCAGRSGPENCVEQCVAGVEAVESLGERCTECVLNTTGWWGRRTVRKSTGGVLDVKTSCKDVRFRGAYSGSSSDIDFSQCVESEMCEEFVFPEPELGSYCGPYCGFDGSAGADMSVDMGAEADLSDDM